MARALGSAMWMYDLTGGARIGKLHKRLKKAEAVAHMPTIPEDRLAGAYLYYDAAADDARLTLALARTAALDHGAVVANHTGVVALLHEAGRVVGATVEADGRRIDVRARAVVNAAGVWSDEVRTLDEGGDPDSIRPAKGIHITVPWSKVRNDIAVVVPVPKDKRSVFVVPWLPTDDGGYELTRDPGTITLLEVVEAAEGPVAGDHCLFEGGPCDWTHVCPVHEAWGRAHVALVSELQGTTFDELARNDLLIEQGKFPIPREPAHPRPVERRGQRE